MKPFPLFSLPTVRSEGADQLGNPRRRRVLRSAIAGLAAYATSFFVSTAAEAQPCEGIPSCDTGSLGENECYGSGWYCMTWQQGPVGTFRIHEGPHNANGCCYTHWGPQIGECISNAWSCE
jgi:hypothetical protein